MLQMPIRGEPGWRIGRSNDSHVMKNAMHADEILATSSFAARDHSGIHPALLGFWRLADPKISLASMAAILLGTCAAAANGPLHYGWLAVTVIGIFALEVAKNASGEIFDFDSGTDLKVSASDRSPYSGGKRVLVDGLLTRRQTKVISAIAYMIGIAAGVAIVRWHEPRVLWIGVMGVACAYFYNGYPLKLSYRGFGEVAVGFCYGPLITLGAVLVQGGKIGWEILFLSVLLGLLITAFLWINEFPDFTADASSGKRNLVVRLGREQASLWFSRLIIYSFVLLAVTIPLGMPVAVSLAFIAAIPGAYAAHLLMRSYTKTQRIIPAQAFTLLTFVLFAAGAGIGLLLGR